MHKHLQWTMEKIIAVGSNEEIFALKQSKYKID
jgi:hypothetical protein